MRLFYTALKGVPSGRRNNLGKIQTDKIGQKEKQCGKNTEKIGQKDKQSGENTEKKTKRGINRIDRNAVYSSSSKP